MRSKKVIKTTREEALELSVTFPNAPSWLAKHYVDDRFRSQMLKLIGAILMGATLYFWYGRSQIEQMLSFQVKMKGIILFLKTFAVSFHKVS